MADRKSIPPMTCDYLIRMHLKSIEAITKYMAGGCQASGFNNSMFACVEMIRLRDLLIKTLDEYSNKGSKDENNKSS